MAAWWANYRPGGVESALERREQARQEARREVERQRERQEAEAQRARLREQQRGGKLAWATRLRETPQMRAIRLAAEAGDADALKCLVTLGAPRQKPIAAGLEGLEGLPIPATEQDMPKVIGFVLERVSSGALSIGDAAALVDLCRARVGAVNVARAPRIPDELFELN